MCLEAVFSVPTAFCFLLMFFLSEYNLYRYVIVAIFITVPTELKSKKDGRDKLFGTIMRTEKATANLCPWVQ